MSHHLFEQRAATVVWTLFFGVVKTIFIVLVLFVGTLIASQSSVAPVSVRLLTSYGMEYAVALLKPVRPLFPQPQVIDFKTK